MDAATPRTLPALIGDSMTYFTLVAPGGISAQMGAALHFAGPIDEAKMARAVQVLMETEPVLGYRFVSGSGGPAWERVAVPPLDEILPVVATTAPDDDAAAFVGSAFDAREGPQVRARLLRAPDQDTLALQVSHVAVDGRGVAEALCRLSAIHRRLAEDPSWTPALSTAERGFASALEGVGLGERLRCMKSLAISFSPNGWRYTDSGARSDERYVFGVIEPAALRALKERGRLHGATVNDLLLTAYHRALCRALRPEAGASTPVSMTADLRDFMGAGDRGLAGYASFWEASVSPLDGEAFGETLDRVVERTRAWKDSGSAAKMAVAAGVADSFARGWRARMLRPLLTKMGAMVEDGVESGNLSPMLTNIGVIDDAALDFGAGTRVERCRWYSPMTKRGLALGAACFRERLEVCMGFGETTADAELQRSVVSSLIGELKEWAAAA